jgi:hypothetical protein
MKTKSKRALMIFGMMLFRKVRIGSTEKILKLGTLNMDLADLDLLIENLS